MCVLSQNDSVIAITQIAFYWQQQSLRISTWTFVKDDVCFEILFVRDGIFANVYLEIFNENCGIIVAILL